MTVNEAPASDSTLVKRLRVAIAVLALLAAGLVLWAALGGGEDDDSDEGSSDQARIVSAAELGALAEDAPGPLYSAGDAFVWVNPDSPTSAYLAEPGAGYQVEVYDPSPRRAPRARPPLGRCRAREITAGIASGSAKRQFAGQEAAPAT